MGEPEWRAIPGYEGLYEVSDFGSVRSLFRYKKQLKPSKQSNGYLSVDLFKEKRRKHCLIHRLVAMAFIPNPENLPQINHKDENRTNNTVENLEWCSAKYNMNYGVGGKTRHSKIDYSKPCFAENARKNGAKRSKPVLQLSIDGTPLKRYCSAREAHRQTGLHQSHILDCCNGKQRKTVGGFMWRFDERNDDLSEL